MTSSNTGRSRRWARRAALPHWRFSVVGGLALTTFLSAIALFGAAAPVAAQPPLDTPPSADGMPGAEFIGELIGWGKWMGLALCGLAFIYGAATWRGFGSTSSGRAVEGKGYVISGAVGAAVIGLVGFVIPMLYRAASG